MKFFYFSVIGALLIGFSACNKANGSFDSEIGTIPANDIQIRDNQFYPATDSVAIGAYIRFINTTTTSHLMISDDTVTVKTPVIAPDSNYTFKINTIGTFRYHCAQHPSVKGVIVMRP